MELLQLMTTVAGFLVTLVVGYIGTVLRDQGKRLNIMERSCISHEQMEKFVELKQAPLYVLLERMADDMHQLRRLMEKQYDRDKQAD